MWLDGARHGRVNLMSRSAVLSAVVALASLVGLGCGAAAEPREQDIWYTSELRPGEVPPVTEGERELLARLDDLPSGDPVAFGGQSFLVEEPYTAASGRVCRSVTVRSVEGAGVDVKLACQSDRGWSFVPDVFGDADARAEAQP